MTRRPSPADGGRGWPWSRERGCGSGAAGGVCGWPRPRVPGAGSSRPDAPGGAGGGGRRGARRQVRGSGVPAERALEPRRSGAPRPARAAALGSPGRGAGGCGRPVGWAEGGSAGALCAEQARGSRGPGRHVHGGPLLCGERVSVPEGSAGGRGGGAARLHLPARRAGGGGETSGGYRDGLACRAMTKRPETCPPRPTWTVKPAVRPEPSRWGKGTPIRAVRGDATCLGFEGISSSAGGGGDSRPSPRWGSSGARGPTSKEGKQHLGRKREMALLSFVVGVAGG